MSSGEAAKEISQVDNPHAHLHLAVVIRAIRDNEKLHVKYVTWVLELNGLDPDACEWIEQYTKGELI